MDESPIKFFQDRHLSGLIAVPKQELKRKAETLLRPASLGLRRSVITLIAFVCDCDEIQKILPQVIVGNRKLLPRWVAALHKQRGDSVYVLSRHSGWNDAKLMCELFKMLGTLLAPFQDTCLFVMIVDAHGAHIAPCVFEAACRAGIFLMVLPASMTHILQPLDTHVFETLKILLWKAVQAIALESSSGEFDIEKFMSTACDTIAEAMSHANPRAFASCGFSEKQQGVSHRVLHALEWDAVPEVGADLPTLHELQLLWPQGKEIPIMSVFRTVLQSGQRNRCLPSVSSARFQETRSPTPPLRLRLRSASRLQIQDPESEEAIISGVPPVVSTDSREPCREETLTPQPRRLWRPPLPVGRPLLPRRARSVRNGEASQSLAP